MKNKLRIKGTMIAFAFIIVLFNHILKIHPQIVEKYYSNSINKLTRQVLSFITGIFPFSVAEFLVFFLIILLILILITLIIKIRRGGFLEQLLNIIVYLSVLYILFMLLWGFNYNRLSFDKIAGLKIQKSSEKELYNLCDSLIKRSNTLRVRVKENSQGVMEISGGYVDILPRAIKGYEKISAKYPQLSGKYGPPKPILLSEKMCYTGITGIYIPYTGEANVNISVPDFEVDFTAAHEMAHQRGFAREEEANYIAYLACTNHPDLDFQYSGAIMALINSMNALANTNMTDYKQLTAKYSAGVKRDLEYDYNFWSKYEGKVQKVANNVNNNYLKSNGEKEGVESYGKMVDLLLAEYRK
ncbi:DUF3810 domain-containing protein [Clostridium sp. PL3]|uniref:DUF3810 domain-containing protein n=1 Tax=Clostridium thailandense TaxID=2794346 RepID=A0A949TLJ2_9CLOT|nr:DUF3810 domain-containing protein [Clostridium thailandense]MBV7271512.1 DUF3810 domain-containing protein [Clostridium thailandense]